MGGKRKAKKKVSPDSHAVTEEELRALEAIYNGDLVVNSDRHGFCLKIMPHPPEAQETVASVVLTIRLPPGYPATAAELQLREYALMTIVEQRSLSKRLHTLAADLAAQEVVCGFDVIESCRAFLQDIQLDSTAEAPSLWHQMQQREEHAQLNNVSNPAGGRGRHLVPPPAVVLPHGDLFDEGLLTMQPNLRSSLLQPKTSGPPATLSSPVAAPLATVTVSAAVSPVRGTTAAVLPSGHRSSIGGEVSASIVRSVLGAVKQGFSAVSRVLLPPGLQRALDSPQSTGINGAVLSTDTEGDDESRMPDLSMTNADVAALRRDLLTGHLLALATRGGLPLTALPAVASSLQERGLMPKWVQWSLTHQPHLFERAFSRLFAEEVEGGGSDAATAADSLTSKALQCFWRASLTKTSASQLPEGGTAAAPSPSRYLSDFQEVRRLGRGGFGAVLLATNRLDGRQYAVKRIEVEAPSPVAFNRLMREVATLSRLQHPHVVRYYQAWFEVDSGEASSAHTDDDSAWLSSQPTAATSETTEGYRQGGSAEGGASTRSPAGSRSVSFALPRPPRGRELFPVAEESPGGMNSHPADAGVRRQVCNDGSAVSIFDRSEELSNPSNQSDRSDNSSGKGTAVVDESLAGGNACASSASGKTPPGAPAIEVSFEDTPSIGTQQINSSSNGDSSSGSGRGFDDSSGSDSNSGSSGQGLWQRWETQKESGTANAAHATGVPSAFSSGDFSASEGRSSVVDSAAPSSLPKDSQHTPANVFQQPVLAPKQLLFIQMEFCPRTLRQVLDDDILVLQGGIIDSAAAWLVVRQILSGLAHIHSQGIIHRDLNPSNIFYDSRGDIRLGDFGLAKFTAAGHQDDDLQDEAARSASWRATGGGPHSEASGVMGTSFYIAPEVEQGQAYTEQVDLFSLGVLTYELWEPFSTAMERVLALRELRLRGKPPLQFYETHEQVAYLVERLLSESVTERPSAREVLTSDMLPPSVEDQALTDMLRSLPDAPDTRDRVLAAVFATPGGGVESWGPTSSSPPDVLQMRSREAVMSALRASFGRHGAVASSFAAVTLASPHDEASKAWLLLAPSGARLALRNELRRPFVEHLAHQAASFPAGFETMAVRRYEIEVVQRRERGRALPAEALAADFDIVGPRSPSLIETALPEAEAILAVTNAVAAVAAAGPCEVRLGHAALVAQAVAFAALPGTRDERDAVIQALTSAGGASLADPGARSKRWQAIRIELEGLGLDGPEIGRCRALVLQLPGGAASASVEATMERFRSRLLPPGAPSAAVAAPFRAALENLKELAGHLEQWGIPPGRLFIDPLVMPTTEHHSRALWQLHLVTPAGTSSLLARGGRYDSLLAAVWLHVAPASTPAQIPGGVGTTVNVDRFVSAASDAGNQCGGYGSGRSTSPLHTSQAQVLVCSRGGGKNLLRERMALTCQLWSAGLRAEFLPLEAPSTREQYEYARAAGIPWMVIIEAATFSATDTVAVKELDRSRGDDEVVPRIDVARFLLDAISTAAPRRSVPASGAACSGSSTVRSDPGRSGAFPGPPELLSVPGFTESEPAAEDKDCSGHVGMTWRQRRRKLRQEVGD